MKKLFVSVPTRGRTEENIRKSIEKLHKIAEVVFDEELEVIPSYIPGQCPVEFQGKSRSMWYLGESIKKMADADYFVGVNWTHRGNGCDVELEAAKQYKIPRYTLDEFEIYPNSERGEYGDYNRFACHCLNEHVGEPGEMGTVIPPEMASMKEVGSE